MNLIAIIRRFRVPVFVLFALAFMTWVVVAGFGDALGVDPVFRDQVVKAAQGVWMLGGTTLASLIGRDDNGNGVPDVLEPESVPPEAPDA